VKHKFIITADDYGLCDSVNAAIEELARQGILSSTNVIMNFQNDFSNTPIKTTKDFSVGLHWNVTTGRPLSDICSIPSLVDKQGEFYSIDTFRKRFRRGLIDIKEIELELQTQYDCFVKCFGQPVYWNTHENSSLYPAEYAVFKRVAIKNNIRATRSFRRVYIDYDLCVGLKRRIREFLVKTYVDIKFGIIEKKAFGLPDARVTTFDNKSKTVLNRMQNGLAKNKNEIIEITIHPSISKDGEYFGNIAEDRVLEYNAYLSEPFVKLFRNKNAEIVSFESVIK